MKKIIILFLTVISFIACDIERLPYGSMAAEQITKDPNSSLDALLNGMYAQLKTWSDPMHRCGEYAGDNIMIRGASTDAFMNSFHFHALLIIIAYKIFGITDIKPLHKLLI